jgi:hypothetical protein
MSESERERERERERAETPPEHRGPAASTPAVGIERARNEAAADTETIAATLLVYKQRAACEASQFVGEFGEGGREKGRERGLLTINR